MSYAFRRRADGAYPISAAQIRAAHKATVSFGPTVTPEVAAALGYDQVMIDPEPAFDADTQRLVAQPPVQGASGWTQGWTVEALTEADIAAALAARVPASVTMRQARLALLAAGLLAQVDAAIAAMPGTEGEAARIEWEYATEVQRQSQLVAGLTAALGLTDAQINTLFIGAAEL